MSARKRLYLLDATAMIYRAHFAFARNPMTNARGENTSASFGFVSALLKILREEEPDYIAAVFDSPQPTFRHEQFAEYKATREKMPDELVAQLGRIDEVVKALNLPNISLGGYEADDLLGTLAKKGAETGLDVVIVTADKDLMQLVDEHVCMLSPGKTGSAWDRIGREQVIEKWGVAPERIVDLLGLMGDTSDNIPGVPRVGEKTAAKLIQEHGSLESVLEAAPGVKQKALQKNLIEYADQARLSQELATIVTDAPVELDLDSFAWTGPDIDRVRPLFQELEFFRFLEELEPEPARTPATYTLVTAETLPDLCAELKAAGAVAVDTETDSLDTFSATLAGISLSCGNDTGYYIPVAHRKLGMEETPSPENVPMELVREHLGPVLADESVLKVMQNGKFDLPVLGNAGLPVAGPLFDTMIASYVLDPAGRHSLDAMAQIHFGHTMIPIVDLIGKGKDQITFNQVPVDKAVEYSGEDALLTWKLYELFQPKLEEAGLTDLMENVETPLMHVLLNMERTGIRIDSDLLGTMSEELTGRMAAFEEEIYTHAGERFNINSTQQLGHILFDVLKLTRKRKTKTGYSTDQSVLEALAHEHPLPKIILEYRHLNKLLSTYVDALPRLVREDTGRVHTSFNQTVTTTGRLSSTDPNLQNIPIRTDLGGQIRKAFIPQEGWKLISADYSQVELRVMAHLSEDETLRQAFIDDKDIHTITASLVFDLPPEFVTGDLRRQAKAINFGVIYGQTPFGLAQSLGIPQKSAANFIDNYFATYPGVKAYNEQSIEKARRDGYVTTMLGRRRYLPEINLKNVNQRKFAERNAINTPIQGTAADVIKVAMINIDRRLREDGFTGRMLLQVHDELIFEVPPEELDAAVEMVRHEMSHAVELSVPLKVDIGAGENWFEAH